MINKEKMAYSCPETESIEIRFGSQILSGSGQAGRFMNEDADGESSYGAGRFRPED